MGRFHLKFTVKVVVPLTQAKISFQSVSTYKDGRDKKRKEKGNYLYSSSKTRGIFDKVFFEVEEWGNSKYCY